MLGLIAACWLCPSLLRRMSPEVALRVISLRCGAWSLSGHSGHSQQGKTCCSPLSLQHQPRAECDCGCRRVAPVTAVSPALSAQSSMKARYARGKIEILHVEALRESACECYEAVRASYNSLSMKAEVCPWATVNSYDIASRDPESGYRPSSCHGIVGSDGTRRCMMRGRSTVASTSVASTLSAPAASRSSDAASAHAPVLPT